MRNFRFESAWVCFLLVLGTMAAEGQFSMPGGYAQFTVSGYGRVFYEPDLYDLSFGVVTENRDIQKCKEMHLTVLDKVKTCLETNKNKIIYLKTDETTLEAV